MKRHITLIMVAVCIALGILSHPGIARAEQPRMEKAADLLREAKKSPAPIALLEKARNHLQDATGNKGGKKIEAIKSIKAAIKIARQGGNPASEINHALAKVNAGIREGEK